MSPIRILTLTLLSTAGACAWAGGAVAADPGVIVQQGADLPAVSGLNGKWEFDPGIITGGGTVRGAGSISAPLGDKIGVQGDGFASYSSGKGLAYGGAGHIFTRDPNAYLAGVTAGFVTVPGATLGAVGLEGELYAGQLSLEGWAGYAGLNYVDPAMLDKSGAFAIGDLGYYATPDFKLSLGGSYILGDMALHAGTEYQFHGLGAPLSLTGDARLHRDGNYSVTVGLKGYFGGDDSKSLIDRQRQDDPDNRALDLFGAAGDQLYATAATPATLPFNGANSDDSCEQWAIDTEQHSGIWVWDDQNHICVHGGI